MRLKIAEAEKYLKGLRDATQADIDAATAAMDADLQAEFDSTLEFMQNEADAEKAIQEQSVKQAEEAAQKKIAAMSAFASGTADLLDAIADAYESNGQLTEKEEKRVKNLRIRKTTSSNSCPVSWSPGAWTTTRGMMSSMSTTPSGRRCRWPRPSHCSLFFSTGGPNQFAIPCPLRDGW